MAEAGHKGKVDMGGTAVGGMFDWRYSGETRETEEIVEFGSDVALDEPTIIKGGVVTCRGNYKTGDAGVALVQAAFVAGTKIATTEIKFFIDDTIHYTPDATSQCICTKFNAIEHEASGVGRLEMEFKVSGQLLLVTV